ncbi:hypothetical protein LSM04_008517 [Trypanosoma melophagium]|uniref:uncharacterized protein n=1 Tax=Trypanosoma melophagium TaxID=715481 RepID=UPI00351A5760|nr:hypothetical protein LSM04_008517 [Trypanosoma melophagium]
MMMPFRVLFLLALMLYCVCGCVLANQGNLYPGAAGIPNHLNSQPGVVGGLPGVPGAGHQPSARPPVSVQGTKQNPHPAFGGPHDLCASPGVPGKGACLVGVPGSAKPDAKGGHPAKPFTHLPQQPLHGAFVPPVPGQFGPAHGSHGATLSSQLNGGVGRLPGFAGGINGKTPAVTKSDPRSDADGKKKEDKEKEPKVMERDRGNTLQGQNGVNVTQQETVLSFPVQERGVEEAKQTQSLTNPMQKTSKVNNESNSVPLSSSPSSEIPTGMSDGMTAVSNLPLEQSKNAPEDHLQTKDDGKTEEKETDSPESKKETETGVNGSNTTHREERSGNTLGAQQESHNTQKDAASTQSHVTPESKQHPTADPQTTGTNQSGLPSADLNTPKDMKTEPHSTTDTVTPPESKSTNGVNTVGDSAKGNTTANTSPDTLNTPSNEESTTTTTTALPPTVPANNKKPNVKGDADSSSSISSVWVRVSLLIVVALASILV